MNGKVKESSKFEKGIWKSNIRKDHVIFYLQFQRTQISSHMHNYATSAPRRPLYSKSFNKGILCEQHRSTVWFRLKIQIVIHCMQIATYDKYIPRELSTYCMYKSNHTALHNGIIFQQCLLRSNQRTYYQ